MLERIVANIKKYALIEGIAIGVLLTVSVYENLLIDVAQVSFEAESRAAKAQVDEIKTYCDLIKDRLVQAEAYGDQYKKEQLSRRAIEAKLQEKEAELGRIQSDYDILLDNKWEEKYKTEKLAREIAENKLTTLREKLKKVQTISHLTVGEKTSLKAKPTTLEQEHDSLRKFESGPLDTSHNTIPPAKVHAGPSGAEALLASLSNVSKVDVGDLLIESIPNIKDGIPGALFVKMLEKANVVDRGRVVESCAQYLQRPLSEKDITSISNLVSSFDAADAMKQLNKYVR